MSNLSIHRPRRRINGLAALFVILVIAALVSTAAQIAASLGAPLAVSHAEGTTDRKAAVANVADSQPSSRGNNGTVKIHDGDAEREPIRENEPHVCTFHLHGFGFDANSSGEWRIEDWPPTGNGTTVAEGTWGPASNGTWRTDVMGLEDGHYKLYWEQTDPSAPGGEKHKVFWVECGVVTETPAATNTAQPTGTMQPTSTVQSTNTSVPPTNTVVNATNTVVSTATQGTSCNCSEDVHLINGGIRIVGNRMYATFRNNSNTCSHLVGVASYQWINGNFEDQVLFDFEQRVLQPHETATLSAELPQCRYQVDAFCGEVIHDFHGGVRYGDRLFDSAMGGTEYCQQGTPTSVPSNTTVPTNTVVSATNTTVPPTSTRTVVPPTNTTVPSTNTPVPPTNTRTAVPPTHTTVPATNTQVPPTNTRTPVPPTNTVIRTSTATPGTSCNCRQDVHLINGGIRIVGNRMYATFHNTSQTCSHLVGVASYQWINGNFEDQVLFDFEQRLLQPGETATLSAEVPQCQYQLDAFCGEVIHDFHGGVRYGERLLDAVMGGTEYCQQGTPTATSVPSNTTVPTNTVVRTTNTPTQVVPTRTSTALVTNTVVPTTVVPTLTATIVPPTNTPTRTSTALVTNTTVPSVTVTRVPPTNTTVPTLTATQVPPTNTVVPPTRTSTQIVPTVTPTNTVAPTNTPYPTSTPYPTNTVVVVTMTATSTQVPPTVTRTQVPPTGTAVQATNTIVPTGTRVPTETAVATATNTAAPSSTSVPTNTSVPPATNTPRPTNTSVPGTPGQPTNTPVPLPTNTPAPPSTNTPVPVPTNTSVPLPTNTTAAQPTSTTAAITAPTSTPTLTSGVLPEVGTPTSVVSQPVATSTPVASQPVATPTRVVSVLPVTGMLANLYVVLATVLSIPMLMLLIGIIARRRGSRNDVFKL